MWPIDIAIPSGHTVSALFPVTDSQPVDVNWVGPNCRETAATQSYTTTCKFTGLGQLLITNPTTLGLGESSNVSIKITQILGE